MIPTIIKRFLFHPVFRIFGLKFRLLVDIVWILAVVCVRASLFQVHAPPPLGKGQDQFHRVADNKLRNEDHHDLRRQLI